MDDSVLFFTARLMAFFYEVCTSEMLLKEVPSAVTQPGLLVFFLKNLRYSCVPSDPLATILLPVHIFKMLHLTHSFQLGGADLRTLTP